jgi:hypothetical protein
VACHFVQGPQGGAIVCTGRGGKRCSECRARATFECDWKMPLGGTCDAYLCSAHATSPAPNKHLCPKHAKAWEAHPRRQLALPGVA